MIGENLSVKMRLMRKLFSGGHFGVTAAGCRLRVMVCTMLLLSMRLIASDLYH